MATWHPCDPANDANVGLPHSDDQQPNVSATGGAAPASCHGTPDCRKGLSPCGDPVDLDIEILYRDAVRLSRRCANKDKVCCQVAERSLFLWNNEAIVGLVAQHRVAVVPAVVPALERNARSHWNLAVHNLSINVRKMFQEMDSTLYDQCRSRFEHDEVCIPSSTPTPLVGTKQTFVYGRL